MLDETVTAVHRRNLEAGLPALAATRGDPEVRALRVEALSRAAVGMSRGIESLIVRDQSNADLWLWLGRTRIEEAWEIKPEVKARAVQAHRLEAYHTAMEQARQPLLTAAGLAPGDPVPWESMLWLALGLERPRADKDSVWFECTRRWPTLYSANVARLVTLSPGWGGTAQEMMEFARTTAARAPEGSPLPALLPLAHFENVAAERTPMSRGGWFSFDAQREMVSAAGQWSERRIGPPHPRSIEAHNAFGAAFYLADLRRPARGHLIRTGGRYSRVPWSHLGDPESQFQRACGKLNVITN
ncbi:hypothetical protein Aph01nite_28410 [Acrocarpospora phusangensis]|uniref:DUF4034 domain-containing protein n=1 Tax=Acrocarpospora phusangensis TaxID=1070424 RepID=A0A919QAM9_9ACTN|nr:hypothetical protein [Acrocarpospora phusangensis]GIH24531.1 hypothetical protein Aph01nite_28410 [Acrocarpospora phusangensis]